MIEKIRAMLRKLWHHYLNHKKCLLGQHWCEIISEHPDIEPDEFGFPQLGTRTVMQCTTCKKIIRSFNTNETNPYDHQ